MAKSVSGNEFGYGVQFTLGLDTWQGKNINTCKCHLNDLKQGGLNNHSRKLTGVNNTAWQGFIESKQQFDCP